MTPRLETLHTLLAPLTNPAKLDFWAQELGMDYRWNRCIARVEAVRKAGRDTVMLQCRPNGNWAGFAPGQHCNVSADINGRRITRSYSLAPVPGSPRSIAIFVRRQPGGLMSNWMLDACKPGTRLELGTPFGEMSLPRSLPKTILLLAAGSGATPMISLMRELDALGMPCNVTLALWDRQSEDVVCGDEMLAIAGRHTNCTVNLVTTRKSAGERTLSGRLNAAQMDNLLAGRIPDLAYACGPRGFVKLAQTLLAERAVNCQTESFDPPVLRKPAENRSSYTVTLQRSHRSIQVDSHKSLLEQLEASGVSVESGCRQGVCNTCSCRRIAGATADITSGSLDSEPEQSVRLCVSRPAADLELDL